MSNACTSLAAYEFLNDFAMILILGYNAKQRSKEERKNFEMHKGRLFHYFYEYLKAKGSLGLTRIEQCQAESGNL